jgi:hypothetical protein
MDYALAKQLKDADFPQYRSPNIGSREYVCIPTLSELIEACGEGYLALEHMPKGWHASKTPAEYDNDLGYVGGAEIESGYHKTPEEAVARLYLNFNGVNTQ